MVILDSTGQEVWIPRIAETFEEAWQDEFLFGICAIRVKDDEI